LAAIQTSPDGHGNVPWRVVNYLKLMSSCAGLWWARHSRARPARGTVDALRSSRKREIQCRNRSLGEPHGDTVRRQTGRCNRGPLLVERDDDADQRLLVSMVQQAVLERLYFELTRSSHEPAAPLEPVVNEDGVGPIAQNIAIYVCCRVPESNRHHLVAHGSPT